MPALQIHPSILAADYGRLAVVIEMLNASEADAIHCDIMDGSFVPFFSFGLPVLKAIRKVSTKPLEVHLMTLEPERYIAEFAQAGADTLIVHQEAVRHLDRVLREIHQQGLKAGVALNPSTPVETLADVLHLCDVVCIVGINPGFLGETLQPNIIRKLHRLQALRAELGTQTVLQIDGGVLADNAPTLAAAGVDVLVPGGFAINGANPLGNIAALKALRNA